MTEDYSQVIRERQVTVAEDGGENVGVVVLGPSDEGTMFVYTGELGADLWKLGQWWADRVAAPWERTVTHSLDEIQAEAERRAGLHHT